jgi:hypothetical protein
MCFRQSASADVLVVPAGLTPDQQRLVFSGKVLEPSKTLDDYGVQPQHSLLLAVRLGAGTAASPDKDAAASHSFYAPMFEGDTNPLLRAAAGGGDHSSDVSAEGAGGSVKLVPVPAVRRSSLAVPEQGEVDGGAAGSAAAVAVDNSGSSSSSSSSNDSSSRVLVVQDVRQLKADVAHGAAQLALYVVMVFDDGASSAAAAMAAATASAGGPADQHTL